MLASLLFLCVAAINRLAQCQEHGPAAAASEPTSAQGSNDYTQGSNNYTRGSDNYTHDIDQADQRASDLDLDHREQRLLRRFESKVFPAMTAMEGGCVDCHDSSSTSPLVLSGSALEDLRTLVDGGYLVEQGPDTLLGRVTSDNADRRMPKDADPWNDRQIRQLRRLIRMLDRQQSELGVAADEQFPRSLLASFEGPFEIDAPTQLLSYRQLKSKIAAIFQDDWVRGDRDLFAEHLSAFGGADFQTRFNESTRPTAAYLSALETLARDVAIHAFRRRTGPFRDFDANAPDPRASITTLYQRILFRSPTEEELVEARDLLSKIQGFQASLAARDTQLSFQVTVSDPSTGRSASQVITLPISGRGLSLQQTIVDQRAANNDLNVAVYRVFTPLIAQLIEPLFAPDENSPFRSAFIGTVNLTEDQSAEVVIHNQGTYRNVTFAGIDVFDGSGKRVARIGADSEAVQVEGAWDRDKRDGTVFYSDANRHKGLSTIRVKLPAGHTGEFSVALRYFADSANAQNVLVELFADARQDVLRSQQSIENPDVHRANFYYHCGDDTKPYYQLPGAFQFEPQSFVEISNRGTLQRVTAAAIDLINVDDPSNNFLIDSKFAKGADQWQNFDPGSFQSYNVRGQLLHDDNQRKGELSLQYLLEDRRDHGWREDAYYNVRIYYPGKSNHEPRVPVEVFARRSTPIVQVEHPTTAKADVLVALDASQSYTIQRSKLEYSWRQVAGPTVEVDDWNAPRIEFRAPRLDARNVAWASLCSALMRHPDFLLTRPPALDTLESLTAADRLQLQLVKLAQDLVGRPPTPDELQALTGGQRSLEECIDLYLDSQAFEEFYFHRIRLYLESQGTTEQDEPARLWSYIAFEDRPFQEILTAEYTVDEHWQMQQRPAQHGKTGVLTTPGFIAGKPGLPHYNYAAQVSMLFLGYIYEVPPEIVEQREGATALGTTDPNSTCYSCHKILTPLALQRLNWTDDGRFRTHDDEGLKLDASDQGMVAEYPFKGQGMEAFALQAIKKERFIRTMIDTHVNFYFGRPMRYLTDERTLYKRLWDNVHQHHFKIRELIRAIVTSPQYLGTQSKLMINPTD